jgi:hypothetical protein
MARLQGELLENQRGFKCQIKLGDSENREELWLIFKNTYGREPTSEELQTFEAYLRLIGAWK